MGITVVFTSAGVITLLQSALNEHLWRVYDAGLACLLAAVVCAAVCATLDGQLTTTAILARRVDDLDARFRRAEARMSNQIAGLDQKERQVLHEMTGLAGALGDVVEDELVDRRRK